MKIGIKILGCPKNTADCEILAGILKSRGHEIVFDVKEADAVVIDTCTFIEKAKVESIDAILDFVEYKRKNRPDLRIYVKGCMVQRYYEDLKSELPEVDGWFGVVPPEEIVQALERGMDLVKPSNPIYEYRSRFDLEGKPYAYVKIADGCDRKCTFCTIPSFKGRYRSRRPEDVEGEVKYLLETGKREIVLVSQDSTAYGTDLGGSINLSKLLERLNAIPGDFWLRVMYLHPDYLSDELIDSMCDLDKVVPYFEIPVQHGSDEILKRMGRIRKSAELMRIFEKIRSICPEATIRTTIMVGFPGEKEEDFERLVEFLEEIHPDRMGVFVYSDEEGTVASTFEDKVDEEIAKEREEIVVALALDMMQKSNERFVGKILRVLIDDESTARGYMDAPEIDGAVALEGNRMKIGEFVDVLITGLEDLDMKGKVVNG